LLGNIIYIKTTWNW